ncbi:Osmotin, thaumatin-like protein [Auriculariales sp. MPI-PUGE-AT-0066]|nr:Osmotin, thaumatin-like protein [Auriculariales sp. MPI-PUGE-AT-0066]
MAFSKVALLAFVAAVSARDFTVKNNCPYTVWPAIFSPPNVNQQLPNIETGWEAASGSSRSFQVPDNWISGRIWGRTGCDFSTPLPGATQCVTGACNGGLLCDPNTGTGVPPASLAEWTLGADGIDWYDVSLVDGSNVPMSITADGCQTADCPSDLNQGCPDPIAVRDGAGNIQGCKSACMANLDGNTGGDSPLCCSGSHATPDTCPPSGITYYDHFKSGCPNSYVYAYDESSGTALWTCDAKDRKPAYTLTFCP